MNASLRSRVIQTNQGTGAAPVALDTLIGKNGRLIGITCFGLAVADQAVAILSTTFLGVVNVPLAGVALTAAAAQESLSWWAGASAQHKDAGKLNSLTVAANTVLGFAPSCMPLNWIDDNTSVPIGAMRLSISIGIVATGSVILWYTEDVPPNGYVD